MVLTSHTIFKDKDLLILGLKKIHPEKNKSPDEPIIYFNISGQGEGQEESSSVLAESPRVFMNQCSVRIARILVCTINDWKQDSFYLFPKRKDYINAQKKTPVKGVSDAGSMLSLANIALKNNILKCLQAMITYAHPLASKSLQSVNKAS